MEENLDQESAPAKSINYKLLLVVIVVLLTAGIAFMVVHQNNLKAEKKAQEIELAQSYDLLDSIGNQLSDKILTISQLGGKIDTLLAIKDKLEQDKKWFRKQLSNQKSEIGDLKDRISGYKQLLLAQDQEIVRLKEINEELQVENTELKQEKNNLKKSIRSLEESKDQLSEKVAIASRLSIEGFKVYAISKKGKKREKEFRNRHLDKLSIEFYVSENEVAPIEGKDIFMRIIGPDGNGIFDVTRGSGTFIFEGREQFYTAKQEILYDKRKQQVLFEYKKPTDYSLGNHLVVIYTDNYVMGKGNFVIK